GLSRRALNSLSPDEQIDRLVAFACGRGRHETDGPRDGGLNAPRFNWLVAWFDRVPRHLGSDRALAGSSRCAQGTQLPWVLRLQLDLLPGGPDRRLHGLG